MPGPTMRRPAPVDVAAAASRLPRPLQWTAGTLGQLLADVMGGDTVASPADPDVSMAAPTPLAVVGNGGRLIDLIKPVGSLAKGLKATRTPGRYALKDQVVERLAQLYRHGLGLPNQSNWEGQTADLLRAMDGDEQLAHRWGRGWGATSPSTPVTTNTAESAAAHLFHLEHPGTPLTVAQAQQLEPLKITMAPSKVPNINRAYADLPLSGDKAEAMAGYMVGQPRLPLDVHYLWAAGSKADKLQPELPALRALMTKAEGLPARGGLTDTDIYLRYEQALRDALQQFEPPRHVGGTFATMWEGTRSAKGLPHQGGPVDILRRKGLLEAGAMLDPERLRQALKTGGWSAGAIAALLAALPPRSPEEAVP